jgi:4-amino-4-deoxy-L-arabinose transferase-like glycosyltransferase
VSSAARRYEWTLLALITALAAALRLTSLGAVAPDPFYDAAVRSMGTSWHNFFFGAFEPSGSVSIDKPPVDLWLQVASVKALGFSSTALKLPQALAGIASAPLCFAALRRTWGAGAGLAAALALAVMPIEVITARSDTMDAVMMALTLLALVMIVRACERDSTRLLLGGAAALGLAFDVKLLESLIALPGLALLAYLGMRGRARRRLGLMLAAGAVYVVVALSWLTATLLFPAQDRPYAIGSTNGSAWNAAFVFNGSDRLSGKAAEAQGPVYEAGHRYQTATRTERDRIPIVPPSPTRLLKRVGPLSGERLGLELLAALLLGVPALIAGSRLRSRTREDGPPLATSAPDTRRVRRAMALALVVWIACGTALFSSMVRLHPRYVESFTPAVAAMLGIGAAWASAARTRVAAAVLATALLVNLYLAERLEYGFTLAWWLALGASLGALALVALPLRGRARMAAVARPSEGAAGGRTRAAPLRGHANPALPTRHASPAQRAWHASRAHAQTALALALLLPALLAVPFAADVWAVKAHTSDAGDVGALPSGERRALSAFLRAHQRSAKYELAAQSATTVASLIVQDARPVLALTTYGGRVFTPVAKLERAIARGDVRYAFLNTRCARRADRDDAACSEPSAWVRTHGLDVSREAGLEVGTLWLLPGARR